jgi:hypothetical protein
VSHDDWDIRERALFEGHRSVYGPGEQSSLMTWGGDVESERYLDSDRMGNVN